MAGVDRFARLHSKTSTLIDQRDPGQQDRDRVLYTYALRRLADVTQVVSAVEGQIFHNRLTHTLEVAQIARRLAEKLLVEHPAIAGRLNPDVVEAAALAHDLGHPPFGHVAEMELDRLAIASGDTDGFEGNAQSFRIVTRLAAHDRTYGGLNLSRATLNAVLKYPWHRSTARVNQKRHKKFGAYRTESSELRFARAGYRKSYVQSLEAAIMDYADGVAYSVHDLDDFFRAGLISISHLTDGGDEYENFLRRWINTGKATKRDVTRRKDALLNLLKDTFYFTRPYSGTFAERADLRTRTSALIREYIFAASLTRATSSSSGFQVSRDILLEQRFLQRIVWEHVIANPRLATQQHGQRLIIRSLYDAYLNAVIARNRDLIPALFHDDLESLGTAPGRRRKSRKEEIRLAVDIVASLTDHQATLMYRRMTGISAGSVADILDG